ncbi:hypothetical protein B0H11DRAFT_1993791 [Mycena galericulata]|nr:hypothetical protein B0H11DRAFT_1993791 [Mycena galericulata]
MSDAPRLPPEVIFEILSHAVPLAVPRGTESGYDRGTYDVPWELALVNQTWRKCALESHTLWTYFTLGDVDTTDPDLVARLECQLERSGSKALHVSLSGRQPFEIIQDSPTFLESCSRWETLLLRPPSVSFRHPLLAHGKFTLLRRLELIWLREESPLTFDQVFNAPSLRELVLTDTHFIPPSPELALPWEKITHLRAFYESPQVFLDIAKDAVNLVDLALRIAPDYGVATIASTTSLPKLRRLYAQGVECLSLLTAPALRDLRCHSPMPPGAVHSFCTRGGIHSSLRSLTLRYFTGTPDDLWGILLDLTALKHLAVQSVAPPQPGVHNPTWAHEMFQGLVAARSVNVCCPSLETFVYSCWRVETDDLGPFFDMVRSRMHRAELPPGDDDSWRCLRYIRFFGGSGPHPPASAYEGDVRDIKARGVDLKVVAGANSDEVLRGLGKSACSTQLT